MQFSLEHFVIHSLQLEGEQAVPQWREQPMPIDAASEELLQALHQKFNSKPSRGIGRFADSPKGSQIENELTRWLAEPESFIGFSKLLTTSLVTEMNRYQLETAGYILLAAYSYAGQQYLFMTLLPTKQQLSCTDDMRLMRYTLLDAESLNLAIRFDLLNFQHASEQCYATFIKGRAGRKVADFFLDAIGISEVMDTKRQAEQLSQVVNDFCDAHLDSQEMKHQLKEDVVGFCKQQKEAGEAVKLEQIENLASSHSEADFSDFIARYDEPLPEDISPDMGVMRKLTRFSGTGKGVSVSFDAKHLGERVIYDEQENKLTIFDVPPNLKDQLQRFLSSN